MEPQNRRIRTNVSGGKDLFADWLDSLADSSGVAAIAWRIDRIQEGNFGDHRPVGGGVWELRIQCGPGYRVYYGEDGPVIVVLLCGGDKKAQSKDIRLARRLWQDYGARK